MSLPEAFRDRLEKIVPREKLDQIVETFDTPKNVTFRVNTLKSTPQLLEAKLTAANIAFETITWDLLDGVYKIKSEDKQTLTQTSMFYEGELYIQNLSSMIPPLLLSPQPEETVLDLAAAPGGKTLMLAGMMQNTGWLSAVEMQRERFFRMCDNLKTQGVTNAHTYMTDRKSVV